MKPVKTSAQPKAPPRITLPANLPIQETRPDLPEDQKIAVDGTPLRCIGEEVSDRLAVVPGHCFIRRSVRPKYVHPGLPEQGIQTAALPARIIEGGLLDESVIADIAIRKFDDHLPLRRISEIYWRDGHINLTPTTLRPRLGVKVDSRQRHSPNTCGF